MRRVVVILFSVWAAVALELFLAAGASWAWGYWTMHGVERSGPWLRYSVTVSRGELHLSVSRARGGVSLPRYPATEWRWTAGPAQDFGRMTAVALPGARPPVAGFFFDRRVLNGVDDTYVILPMWAVTAALGALPGWVIARHVRRRRRAGRARAWCCGACGYDCRATPERCPECGTVAPRADGVNAAGAGGA
jgi:hypothetical protein